MHKSWSSNKPVCNWFCILQKPSMLLIWHPCVRISHLLRGVWAGPSTTAWYCLECGTIVSARAWNSTEAVRAMAFSSFYNAVAVKFSYNIWLSTEHLYMGYFFAMQDTIKPHSPHPLFWPHPLAGSVARCFLWAWCCNNFYSLCASWTSFRFTL